MEEYERFFSLENELHSHSQVNAKTKGADIRHKLELTFAEMITGVKKIIGYHRVTRCDTCHGKKVKVQSEQQICSYCYGTGHNKSITGELCSDCCGTGLKSVKCESCNGDGVVSQDVKFSV